MEQALKSNQPRICFAQATGLAIGLCAAASLGAAHAQSTAPTNPSGPDASWQQCADLRDDASARLVCFDGWAKQQQATSSLPETRAPAVVATTPPVIPPPVKISITTAAAHDCRSDEYSELSRFWELEVGSDCGTFGIRGFRPISLSWIAADGVNKQPTTPAPGHTADTPLEYRNIETRLQLSIRTKIAEGLLTQQEPLRRDSVWFSYSQQSNWQIFSGDLSRPFRTTDHEPELTYIYPIDFRLPLGWRMRYAGISANHQSNGQSLPLSRSWNRSILMMGLEKGDEFSLQARFWRRMKEDSVKDDNPDISDLMGRAEVSGNWNINKDNALRATVRHSLRSDANGSVRLEWFKKLGESGVPGGQNGLRLHTQLFSGYGDSLVDYNRRRNVFSVGLSLVDW